MSKQSEFTKCLMAQIGDYRKKIHGEEFFSPRQKELFPRLKRDLNMEIEDAARSDDPLEACMERRGYKPSKTQIFQEAISAKLTADMFGKQEKLTGAEAMFQEQMQECLDRLKNKPKIKFGLTEREEIEKRAQTNLEKRIKSGHKAAETRYVELMKRSDAQVLRDMDANGETWIGRYSDVFEHGTNTEKNTFPRWRKLIADNDLKLDARKNDDSVWLLPLEQWEIAKRERIIPGSLVKYGDRIWEVAFVHKRDYAGTVNLQRKTAGGGVESCQRVPISILSPPIPPGQTESKTIPQSKGQLTLFGKGGTASEAYISPIKPYEMTYKEWESEKSKAHPENVQTNLTKRSASEAVRKMERSEYLNYNTPGEWNDITEQFQAGHKDVILKALAEDKRIPEQVLNQYPDLKRMSKEQIDQQYLNQIKDKFIFWYLMSLKKIGNRTDELRKVLDLVLPLDYTQRVKLSKFIVESAGGSPLPAEDTQLLQASLVQMVRYRGLINAMRDYFGKQIDFTTKKQIRLPKQSVMKFIPEQLHLFGAAPTGTEPYMKDSPISKELQHRFEQTTFYPYDMNKEFNDSVSAKENEAIESLKKYGITEIPEDIKTALAYHRKALYEWLVNKANQVPGPMITGPSKYNYKKLDKSIAREDKSYDSLETSREYIIQALKRATRGRNTTIQQESRNNWKAEALITPKREFANKVFQSAYDKANPNLKADYDNGVFVTAVKNKGRKFHKELIEEALKEGLEISPSVKKDYPEMFSLEKPKKATRQLTEYEKDEKAMQEHKRRQEESERTHEEWSRSAKERIAEATKRIEERKTPTEHEWKAKHSGSQLTMPNIISEQFRLFGKSLERSF